MNATSVDSIITRLRPRDVGGIIDQSFRLYRRHFLTFLAIIAVIYAPIQLGIQVATLLFVDSSRDLSSSSSLSNDFSSSRESINQMFALLAVFGGVVLILALLGAVLQYISQGALTASVADSYLDRPVSFTNAYREVRPRIWSLIGYMGLIVLIVMGAVAVLFVPFFLLALSGGSNGAATAFSCLLFLLIFPAAILAVYITIKLQAVVPAIVIEGLGPVQAMRRSWGLVNNYWWRTFGITMLMSLLVSIASAGPAYIIIGLTEFVLKFDPLVSQAISSLVTVIIAMFFVPLQLITTTLYYFDLRVRREGFDLDAAIQQAYPQGYGYGQGPMVSGQWSGASDQQPNPMYPPTLGYQQQAQQAQPAGYSYGYTSPPTQPVPQEDPHSGTDQPQETVNLNAPVPAELPVLENATPYGNDPLGLHTPGETPSEQAQEGESDAQAQDKKAQEE
jgi:hypothetical protein